MIFKDYVYLLDVLKEHTYVLKDDLQHYVSMLKEAEGKMNSYLPSEEDIFLEKEINEYRIEIKVLNGKIKGINDLVEKINTMEIS